MDFKKFKTWGMIITAVVVLVIGWGIKTGNTIPGLAILILWFFIAHIMRRKVDEPLHDERVFQVTGLAARRTFQFMALGMGLTGATIVFSEDLYSKYRQAAITLGYSIAAMALLYTMFYMYYHHRPKE